MSLQIIYGPMFSGKTSCLIETINNLLIAKKISGHQSKILLINNKKDDRNIHRVNNLTTHNNKINNLDEECVVTFNTETLLSISDDILKDIEFIAIDECQFFNDLSAFVRKILQKNKNVICSGLIADANRNKFGQLLDIFPLADKTIHLKSFCVYCIDIYTKTASFTKLKNKKINLIQNNTYVSAEKDYEPVCGKHF